MLIRKNTHKGSVAAEVMKLVSQSIGTSHGVRRKTPGFSNSLTCPTGIMDALLLHADVLVICE